MGVDTKIEWCHHTFNPWWGCQRISPACGGARGEGGCYAEAFSKRIGGSPWAKGLHWGPGSLRTIASEKQWAQPLAWNSAAEKAGERRRVFCASMADVGEDRRDLDAPRARLRALIEATPHLDWLLLTKRPETIVDLMGWPGAWPRNVWAGTTVEDQRRADERIPHLLRVPAAVRFLSCEPLLGPVDLTRWMEREWCRGGWPGAVHRYTGSGRTVNCPICGGRGFTSRTLDWVIVGGESGHDARPFDLAWARSLVGQCRAAGVPAFVKQLGAAASDPVNGLAGARLRVPADAAALVSLRLKSPKGGDPAEWPADLRVREFPEARHG